jgi:hypothetical protein
VITEVSTLSICSTRSAVVEDVDRGGRAPPPGAPNADHETLHEMVAVTRNAPSSGFPSADGWPADGTV